MQHPRVTKESERRVATVVFADIAGFTAMSEKLDPEDVTQVMNRCFAMLSSVVVAHGGHVDKYIGDCVMALFGVPAALEKAPQQAINAAIEMRNRLTVLNEEERLPVKLAVHTGINTGLVIAGQVGGEVKQEFTVMGDVVNLASRLKDVAPNGAIWVGQETYRYTREEFEYAKLQPLTLKGKEKPVEAWELRSVKERVHRPKPVGAERMIASALVGRDAEFRLLRACLASTARGEGGIVNLIGEAGLGKSRLLAETCASEEAKALLVLEGRSLSIGQSLSFHPFVDLLQQWAGIDEEDGEPGRLAKLEARVQALFPDEAGELFPFVATLMGMRPGGAHAARIEGIAGEAMEKLIVRSMRRLLQQLAATRPLVLVFEDLHWADLSSVQLLESLLRLVSDHPILFLHAFRPDHAETSGHVLAVARERFGQQQIEIALEPLGERVAEALIRNLLKTDDVPYPVLARIARTGEGNPFYIEEVVRALIDEGAIEQVRNRLVVTNRIDEVVIPGTIQGVIMARVDRLGESTRQVLQVASVLGRSFYHRLLAQVVPEGVELDAEIGRLKERQLLLERRTRRTATVRRSTLAEELEYVFGHALVQETIYGSILQRTRKELHGRVAQAIEATFADRLADFYAMLAYHFSRAENAVKAEEYLFRAGDEAARSAASSEALTFFREASRLYLVLNPEGGDPRKKALLEKNIGLALLNKGQLTESIEHFDGALAHLGEKRPGGTVAAGARFFRDFGAVLFHTYVRPGRHRGVKDLDHEREVCELLFYRGRAEITSDPRRLFLETVPGGLRRFNRVDPREIEHACSIYVSCAGVFAYSGISFKLSERMLGLAGTVVREGSVRDRFVLREANFIHHYVQGNWDGTYAIDDELVEQALRYGEVLDVTNYLGLAADRRLRRGEFDEARQLLEKLVEINDSYGYGFAGTSHDGYLALLLTEQRQLDRALRVTESYAAGRHEYAMQVFALGVIAKLRLLSGEREAAAAALARARGIAAQSALISPWHQCTYLLGRLLFDATALEEAIAGDGRGRRALAHAARRSARRALRLQPRIAKERTETYKLAGRVAWLLGRRKAALRLWAKSIAEGERMGARPELARTYLEVGQRLSGAGGGQAQVGGLDARTCLARAEQLFIELDLGWDLDQLRGAEPAAARAAGGGPG